MSEKPPSKMFKKSAVFSKHGKHAKIDPRLLQQERKARPAKWYSSIKELFRHSA